MTRKRGAQSAAILRSRHPESQRADGAVESVGIGGGSAYLDERPLLVPGQPEVRQYRLRFWDKGEANGDWTDWRETTVAP